MDVSDIEVFNPKLRRTQYCRGKSKDTIEALFPCYIFSRFNPGKYYHMIKYTSGVKRVVGDGAGNPYIVDEGIIDLIKSKANDGFIHIQPSDFNAGDRVTVQEGPLKGLTGIFLEEVNARDRVLILLNTITYQARITIEKSFLARA